MEHLFNKFLGAESHASKSPFDLSCRQVYSTKAGLISTPVYIHTMGDSTYSIDMEHVCRTQPLETAAFTKFSSHYEWFFVPYNDLYHSFNQVLAQREDRQSTTAPKLTMPCFDLKQFLMFVLPWAAYDYVISQSQYEERYENGRRNSYFIVSQPNYFNIQSSSSYDFDHDVELSTLELGTISSFRQKYCICREFPNESVCLGVIRNLDLMGYGNYLPIVKAIATIALSVVPILNDQQSATWNLDAASFIDVCMEIAHNEIVDHIVVEYKGLVGDAVTELDAIWFSQSPQLVNLWTPLAYNKIFEQVYRNPYYDFTSKFSFSYEFNEAGYVEDYEFEYVQLFNLDDVNGKLNDMFRLLHIFAPHYHQYHKDMFTGVMPDTQFGDVSVLTDDRSWLQLESKFTTRAGTEFERDVLAHQTTSSNEVNFGNLVTQTASGNYFSPDTKFRFDPALAISVLNMRKAEALQRFSENMMRAGNRTRDAFRAHFGFTPLSEQRNNVLSVGSFDGDIDLNVVASTTDSESVQLGQLAANGVGTLAGRKITFNSHDFGVLVCCHYIHKPAEYDAYGLDKLNQNLDPFDYPYNEFQNVSLAPLESQRLGYQLQHQDYSRIVDVSLGDDSSIVKDTIQRTGILGFLPAFIERKTNVDKIHGEFFSAFPFLPNTEESERINKIGSLAQGDFSHFVTPRNDNNFSETCSWLYINPNSVDNVFSIKATAAQNTDQFFINLNVTCYATQPLSVIGLPY